MEWADSGKCTSLLAQDVVLFLYMLFTCQRKLVCLSQAFLLTSLILVANPPVRIALKSSPLG